MLEKPEPFVIVTESQISQMAQDLLSPSNKDGVKMQETQLEVSKRLSIRKVAMLYGIPARAVSRAVANGELPALKTKTETGRDRVYISGADAHDWICSLQGSKLGVA